MNIYEFKRRIDNGETIDISKNDEYPLNNTWWYERVRIKNRVYKYVLLKIVETEHDKSQLEEGSTFIYPTTFKKETISFDTFEESMEYKIDGKSLKDIIELVSQFYIEYD